MLEYAYNAYRTEKQWKSGLRINEPNINGKPYWHLSKKQVQHCCRSRGSDSHVKSKEEQQQNYYLLRVLFAQSQN